MTFRSPPNSKGVAGVLTQCIGLDNIYRSTGCSIYPVQARIQGGFLVIGNPPTAVCNLFLLVDLLRALQQFGSAPEIPVRTPPPLLNVRTPPPLLNPGSAPAVYIRLVLGSTYRLYIQLDQE